MVVRPALSVAVAVIVWGPRRAVAGDDAVVEAGDVSETCRSAQPGLCRRSASRRLGAAVELALMVAQVDLELCAVDAGAELPATSVTVPEAIVTALPSVVPLP